MGLFSTEDGLFTGGGWHLVGIQLLGLAVLCVWGFLVTRIGLKLIWLWIPIRATEEEEEVGLDISYHGIMAIHRDHQFIVYDEDRYRQIMQEDDDD